MGHGGRTSLLPLTVVAVETHQKVILEKGWLWGSKRQPLRTALKFYI